MDNYFGPGGLSEAMEDEPRSCTVCGCDIWNDDALLCEDCRREADI